MSKPLSISDVEAMGMAVDRTPCSVRHTPKTPVPHFHIGLPVLTETRTTTKAGDLRAIAEAATPGPWTTRRAASIDPMTAGDVALISETLPSEPGRSLPIIGEVWAERLKGSPDPRQARADAAHIAAWSPDRALAALDVIEAADVFLADYRSRLYDGDADHSPLSDALDRWDALP